MKTRQRDPVGLVLRHLPHPSEFGKPDEVSEDQFGISKISLDMLVEVRGRRRRLTPDQYEQLIENLSHNPLATPVTVRQVDGGKFEIISGHNRVAAYRELGRTEIEIHVVDLDDDGVERAAFYANLLSSELPDYHKYLGFKARMASTGKNQSEIAQEAGINKGTVSRLMSFGALPSVVLNVIERNPEKFGVSGIFEISKLVDQRSADLISQVLEKVSNEEISMKQAIFSIKTADQGIKKQKIEPEIITIRRGNTTFCSVRKSGASVRLDFADTAASESLIEEIESLIKRRATESD